MEDEEKGTYSARIKRTDRPFIEAEMFRLLREGFRLEGRFPRPSVADVVNELFRELRELRERFEACTCGVCSTIEEPVEPEVPDS